MLALVQWYYLPYTGSGVTWHCVTAEMINEIKYIS